MNEPQAKLTGRYIPCNLKCGAPEPCFGCDPGDYEWPSIPGKPETFSPEYRKVLDILGQDFRGTEPMTQEQAGYIYDRVNELVYWAVPEGGALLSLFERLAVERSKGLRCSVCGKYQDKSCILDC